MPLTTRKHCTVLCWHALQQPLMCRRRMLARVSTMSMMQCHLWMILSWCMWASADSRGCAISSATRCSCIARPSFSRRSSRSPPVQCSITM